MERNYFTIDEVHTGCPFFSTNWVPTFKKNTGMKKRKLDQTLDSVPLDIIWYVVVPYLSKFGGLCYVSKEQMMMGAHIHTMSIVHGQMIRCALQHDSVTDLYDMHCDGVLFVRYKWYMTKWAAKGGNIDIYDWTRRMFLSRDDSVNTAIKYGHLPLVEHIRLRNQWKYVGLTLLHALKTAARFGHLHIVVHLMEKGATGMDDALISAAEGGYVPVIEYLLEHGAKDVNLALCMAASKGNLATVKWLMEHGTPHHCDTHSIDAMRSAIEYGHIPVIDYILSLGDYNMGELLKWAAICGNLAMVKHLLANGAFVKNKTRTYVVNVALSYAVGNGHVQVVKYLLANGVTRVDRAMKVAHNGSKIRKMLLAHRVGLDPSRVGLAPQE